MENEVLLGDCKDTLKKYPAETFDCIVTDPPYGYSFMNRAWDRALPSIEALKECCRVLKPGAFGFFMCAPRQDVLSRMIIRLEDAGFNTGFTSILWCYATGFPKAQDASKVVDRRRDDTTDVLKVSKWLNSKIKEAGIKYAEILSAFGFNEGSGQVGHWTALSLGAQPTVPTWEQWGVLKDLLKLSDECDNEVWRLNGRKGTPDKAYLEREVVGKTVCGNPTKWYESMDCSKLEYDITIANKQEAKQVEGAYLGFNPKPATEIITVVMKPLSEKTYVDQALKNGKGVTWLSNCRIPYESDSDLEQHIRKDHGLGGSTDQYQFTDHKKGIPVPEGRFPANLLVSDDVLNDGITHKSGDLKPEYNLGAKTKGIYGEIERKPESVKGDSGSFSRYFDLDAWFKSKLPEQAQKTYPYLIVPKPAKSEKNKYCENKHPTVKPLKLMSYLITMGSREGDLILDPFAGSGTTLEAARLLNRKFVGCELTEEYKDIIEARAGVSISPYRNIIEVPEYTEASLDDLERTLEDTERESYEDMLIESPAEVFDTVRRAYWKGKGLLA